MGRTIAFVGAGNVARFHMDAVAHLPDGVDLTVAAADPNPDARDAFAEEFPDAELYDDMETMLARPAEPRDIVVIAVPPAIHREAAITGLESGRHVLCEKPLATSHEESAAMCAAADDADRLLGSCGCRFLGRRRPSASRRSWRAATSASSTTPPGPIASGAPVRGSSTSPRADGFSIR